MASLTSEHGLRNTTRTACHVLWGMPPHSPRGGGSVARSAASGSAKVHHARLAHIVLREASFVSLSVLGAILFLNHQILYMTGEKPSSLSWLAYAASTAVIYGFVRGIFFVGGMRVPHVAEDPSVCPECGQPLADGTPLAPQPAGMRSPHAAHAARPTPTAFRGRLAQPIVSSTPSVPT